MERRTGFCEKEEFNRLMTELQDVEDNLVELKSRTKKGYVPEQNVDPSELCDVIDRLDCLHRDALEFLDETMAEYRCMIRKIEDLREEANFSYRFQASISTR
ncbi:hypothetical protein IKF92_00385 [Candidatus Saccharibacteria bacterium]|nr:hypothetical protein [Candidatus Saccharibacteria bacterium]